MFIVMSMINKANNLAELIRLANKNKSKLEDFTYSATIRYIRKHHPKKLMQFLKTFKNIFDKTEDKTECEEACLMQSLLECDLKELCKGKDGAI